jgi:CheY-like chemotaxis protein
MPKILLVEDNQLTRMAGERSLAKAGYTVVSAKDAQRAGSAAAVEAQPGYGAGPSDRSNRAVAKE